MNALLGSFLPWKLWTGCEMPLQVISCAPRWAVPKSGLLTPLVLSRQDFPQHFG
jgi:hypothetical protein